MADRDCRGTAVRFLPKLASDPQLAVFAYRSPVLRGLSESESVQWLFWEDSFEYSEVVLARRSTVGRTGRRLCSGIVRSRRRFTGCGRLPAKRSFSVRSGWKQAATSIRLMRDIAPITSLLPNMSYYAPQEHRAIILEHRGRGALAGTGNCAGEAVEAESARCKGGGGRNPTVAQMKSQRCCSRSVYHSPTGACNCCAA